MLGYRLSADVIQLIVLRCNCLHCPGTSILLKTHSGMTELGRIMGDGNRDGSIDCGHLSHRELEKVGHLRPGAQYMSVMLFSPHWSAIAACGRVTASRVFLYSGATPSLTTTLKVGATVSKKAEPQRTQRNHSDLHPATCFKYLIGILNEKQNLLAVSTSQSICLLLPSSRLGQTCYRVGRVSWDTLTREDSTFHSRFHCTSFQNLSDLQSFPRWTEELRKWMSRDFSACTPVCLWKNNGSGNNRQLRIRTIVIICCPEGAQYRAPWPSWLLCCCETIFLGRCEQTLIHPR